MKIIDVRKYIIRVAIPLMIVVGLMISGIYFLSDQSESSKETLMRVVHAIIITSGLWIGCTSIVNWLWEKFPWQEYPVKHLLIEIVLIFLYTISFGLLLFYFERNFLNYYAEIDIVIESFNILLITYLITAVHEAYFFFLQWKHNFSKSIRLEKDNIEANYEALKNQINPHFLFNGLNSLTNLVDDNPKAVDYISNLSDFLRYLLQINEKDLVSVRDEVDIVRKYIDLQQLRFGDAVRIEYLISDEHLEMHIPPLVLQMLVENAIKHNIISQKRNLGLSIYSQDNYLVVKNNLNKKTSEISTGRGLNNIIERYSFFTPEKIIIKESNSSFEVNIPILSIQE